MNKKTVISATVNTMRKLKVLAKKGKKGSKNKMKVTVENLGPKARKSAVAADKGADIYKNKKTVTSAASNTILKLKVSAKRKEDVRSKLAVSAKQLAITAREKESVRSKLAVTAKKLASTAKEKESIRAKLEIIAEKLAKAAKEKEDVRRKLAENTKQAQKAIENVINDLQIEKKNRALAYKDLEKFKFAADNISDQVIITDANAIVLYINKAAEKTTGYAAAEVVGGKAGKLWGNLMEEPFYENLWKIIKSDKKNFVGEIRNQRKNKQVYDAVINISPILDKKGDIEFFVGIERDITKEKEINRLRSEFVTIVSHQLRTPLTGIRWTVDRLLKKADIPPGIVESLNDINESTIRLSELVDSLLNISRIESGTVSIDMTKLEIVKFLDDYFKESRILFKKKDIVFNFTHTLDKLEVITDRGAFQNIIQSVLYNATEYTPEKGEIEVVLEKKKNTFLVSVKDTGIGIPEEEQGKVFSKFFRASNAKLVKAGGTGVGLFIASESVKLLGGRIWFETKLNQGTIFYIELPLISKLKDGAAFAV